MKKQNQEKRQEFTIPEIQIVKLETTDIIAYSGGTKGNGSDFDGDDDW